MASPATSSHHDLESDVTSGRRLLLLALLLTAFAYLATVRFDFVYDDGPQIINNPTLTSWKTLPTLFTGHSWKFLLPDWAGNYYRPIFMTWLLLNRKLFESSPAAFHATTILVHLVVTWLAYLVARLLLRSNVQAGYVALLFGLHPVHIESVAWVSGVTDPLMAAFVLAAFWAWIKAEREPNQSGVYRGLTVLFYAAGCLCKETALFLPVVIVAHDVLRGQFERDLKGLLRAIWDTLVLWITAAAYLVVRSLALRGLVHSDHHEPLANILLTIPTIIWGYMRRLVWPVRMSVFYDTPPVTSPLQWRFILPFVALIVAAVFAWRIGKRTRLTGLALLWILVFLAPAILGLLAFPRGEWVHDRYLYLPSFGFCLLLVYATAQLPSRRELFGLPATQTAIILIVSAAMALGTAYEEQYWANEFMLFARGTQVAPNSALAKAHLANDFFRRGDLEDTERLYQEALALDPANWKNHVAYALMLYYSAQYERADAALAKSEAMVPSDSNQYFYQGLSRFNLGHYSSAEQGFSAAIHFGPGRARYHFWRGFSLEKQGRLEEARAEYQQELQQHPDSDTLVRERLQALAH